METSNKVYNVTIFRIDEDGREILNFEAIAVIAIHAQDAIIKAKKKLDNDNRMFIESVEFVQTITK